MSSLSFVPADELARIRGLSAQPEDHARIFATVSRINTLYMIARAGSGHIGTSFSCIDIVSWLYLNELRLPAEEGGEGDVFFSSKGHDAPGLYSVLIGLGRIDFDYLHRLRRLGGLPGHPDVRTPGMVTNTGPLGMGISKAKGMVHANRLLGRAGKVYVLTGDGELQEGQIWESLATAVRDGMGEITVIVDRNKVQSDTWVDEVSSLGELQRKFEAFGWYARTCDGHDLSEIRRTFEEFGAVTDRPKVLIADTLKGKGVSFMEPDAMDPVERLYKYHSGAPAPEAYEKGRDELVRRANEQLAELGAGKLRLEGVERQAVAAPSPSAQRLVGAYSEALVKQGERNPRLVALDADLVLDCGIIPFRKRFPERFFECGIAEQDMVSQAGAMALSGLLPVVHSFACFLSTRPNEQIYNNATEHSKIVYVAPLAGLLPGGPGHSHQSVRDITAVGGTPGLVMIQPSCEAEVAAAMEYCVNETTESSYIRLVSIPVDVPFELPGDYALRPGQGTVLRGGRDGVIIAYGPVMLSEAYRAAEILQTEKGLDLTVVNLPWLNRVDGDWLGELVAEHPAVFTVDDHYLKGGQGEMILAALMQLPQVPPVRARRFGVTDVPHSGGNVEVLQAHRLDARSLAEDIAQALSEEHAGAAAR